jgi:hypothetical protein
LDPEHEQPLTLFIVPVVDNGCSVGAKGFQNSKEPVDSPSQRASLSRKHLPFVPFLAPIKLNPYLTLHQ